MSRNVKLSSDFKVTEAELSTLKQDAYFKECSLNEGKLEYDGYSRTDEKGAQDILNKAKQQILLARTLLAAKREGYAVIQMVQADGSIKLVMEQY